MIDKLIFYLLPKLSLRKIQSNLENMGLKLKDIRFKEKGFFKQIHGDKHGICLKLSWDKQYAIKVTTRPSTFEDWKNYEEHIKSIFGNKAFQKSIIVRIDLSINIKSHLIDILKGLDVKNKRAFEYHKYDGDKLTGVYFGKGNEVILIYDKVEEQKRKGIEITFDHPLTRIEFQLTGCKLPVKKLPDIPLLSPEHSNRIYIPQFKHTISLSNIDMVKFDSKQMAPYGRNYGNLERLIKTLGFAAARRALNKNNNFNRTYGRLINITKCSEQPDQLLEQSLLNYFQT